MTPTDRIRQQTIEECARLLEDRFGERLQRRQAVQCLRSLAERSKEPSRGGGEE